jgi:hypothetical protein
VKAAPEAAPREAFAGALEGVDEGPEIFIVARTVAWADCRFVNARQRLPGASAAHALTKQLFVFA